MRSVVKFLAAGLGALLLAAQGGSPARAQADYPSRLITLIVPFAAGGPTDVVARIIGQNMSRTLGQDIVIENVVGAGGTTGAIRAMRARPDGYTIIMGHMGTHAAAVALYPNLPYDPSTDFEPIGSAVGMPVILLVRKDAPVRDLAEFISYARQNADKLNMAHAGVGSVSHITCQLFNSIIGIKPNLVAFQGTGPAMNAVIAGKVDYMCDQVVNVVPQVQAGSIHALVVGTPRRIQALPDVPTSQEAGMAEFQASAWNALFAPKGTPRSIVTTLNAALGRALDDPTVRQRVLALGGDIPDPRERSPEALAKVVKIEIAKWTAIMKGTAMKGASAAN